MAIIKIISTSHRISLIQDPVKASSSKSQISISPHLSNQNDNGHYTLDTSQFQFGSDTDNHQCKSIRLEICDIRTSQPVGRVDVPLIVNPSRRFRHRRWRALGYRSYPLSKPHSESDSHSRRSSPDGLTEKDQRVGGGMVRAYDILDDRDERSIIVLRVPEGHNWMSEVPDETPLGGLTIPGTHESCALYGYPVSQCQQPSTPIAQQFRDGVRYFDVRLRVVGDELLMYHGPRPQRSSLPILLDVLHLFLAQNPSETFILCLKEESPPFHPNFSSLVHAAFQPYSSLWYLHNAIPTLGEVRGKGILMTRFEDTGSWTGGIGIHPSTWPDSRKEGFEWDCNGTRFRVQDWYRLNSFLLIPEKFEVITHSLEPTLNPDPSYPFTLTYTSASSFPLSLPTTIAKGFGWPEWGLGVYGVNQRMMYWLLRRIAEGKRVRACFAIDFYRQCGDDRGLADILMSMNLLSSGEAR